MNLVPANAPFTESQRAWLNGLFAGLLGGQVAAAATSPAALVPAAQPEAAEEFPWHDAAMPLDERLKLAEDRPHERKLMAAMAQLDCGSCGYLCQTYAEAIARGEEKDLTRCTPGGRDTSRALKQLQASAPREVMVPVSQVTVRKTAEAKTDAAYDRIHPFPARLLSSTRLNGPGSAKDTRLVTIDLRGSGITYKPGDALGVYPENCPDLVEQVLEALGATGAEDVPGWDDQPISLRDALLREFTITRPSPDLLDLLSRSATDPVERSALAALGDSEEGAGDLQILDILNQFRSARPAPLDFVATLSPLAPRLYSISSSQRAHPDQVHLTVGAVRYANRGGRACKGVASTFLSDRVRPGQKVRVFVHTSHRFALPAGDKPIIMVGPGTGIAPFRAFLQERHAAQASGRNWLIFGDQTSAGDFLYREELQQYQRDGLLSRFDTAFSRDQAQKLYVQRRMIEHGAELWNWLRGGAHFYVCGDAKRMAADVDQALRKIIREHGGFSAMETDRYVADLTRGGRYQRDVY
jgi:sulfite reductase (NADPH) flavoprotein alpha-component